MGIVNGIVVVLASYDVVLSILTTIATVLIVSGVLIGSHSIELK